VTTRIHKEDTAAKAVINPGQPLWREVQSALEARDSVAAALEGFLGGEIDEKAFHRAMEAAADCAKKGAPGQSPNRRRPL
jgi:hypothetical protein